MRSSDPISKNICDCAIQYFLEPSPKQCCGKAGIIGPSRLFGRTRVFQEVEIKNSLGERFKAIFGRFARALCQTFFELTRTGGPKSCFWMFLKGAEKPFSFIYCSYPISFLEYRYMDTVDA